MPTPDTSRARSNASFDPKTIAYLSELSRLYPTADAALARLSAWEAEMTLPKSTVHVISDIHGEHVKLRHVINNASGCLRPLVDKLFGATLSEADRLQLLNLIYYPLEMSSLVLGVKPEDGVRRSFIRKTVERQALILRELAHSFPLERIESTFPAALTTFFQELLTAPVLRRSNEFVMALVDQFVTEDREVELLRSMSRVIRNLSIAEIIIAGDFGDRGPRIDRVIDYVMRQPRVSITWGNHDVSWMGACLGSWVCIATVIRMSLRYQRLSQLEEGYGIPLTPLEDLVAASYSDDPAKQFVAKGVGTRDPLLVARMQKAISILQFKLEAAAAARNPHYGYEHRNLLHRISADRKSVDRYGTIHPLLDSHFPTVDPKDPYRLSAAEERCMQELTESFLFSPRLWEQMKFLADHGAMYLTRDQHLIFHACVPVDADGAFLSFPVDGVERKGRDLFEALTLVVQRAFRERRSSDLDMLWYLWSGPRSPLFGKDCMATFETYFLADKESHKEHKNPYFALIHEAPFCDRILAEFGVRGSHSLIVNGHVPVKIEKGESPLKKSGKAVTIDGAFSQAYGDKGYTLVLEADRTYLAQHHQFDSVISALENGTDIIPTVQVLTSFDPPRTVRETERGEHLQHSIDAVRLLIQAYRENRIQERR
jgi:fructose-1,6-bisphosphatase-3